MQDLLTVLGVAFLAIGLAGILALFLGYPCFLLCAALGKRRRDDLDDGHWPGVSIIVAVRNGEDLVLPKIENCLSLDYPEDLLEVVIVSDGSDDATAAIAESCRGPRVKVDSFAHHVGKANALNRAVSMSSGGVLVFSDADSILQEDSLRTLVRHYRDPGVGGVCGQRIVAERSGGGLRAAQCRYIQIDSAIKALENRVGCVTSNDGKLYSIRRELYRPIDPRATDDLFSCLSVVRQGSRFVFEPRARASIRVPSRDPGHEIARRRRIVARSLRGIFAMREVLNPLKHGSFAVGLLINKVLRRLLPVCLILILIGSILTIPAWPAMTAVAAIQILFYAGALAYPLIAPMGDASRLRRSVSIPFYFFLGNYGTLLGLIDFLRGRTVVGWNPVKAEAGSRPSSTTSAGSGGRA